MGWPDVSPFLQSPMGPLLFVVVVVVGFALSVVTAVLLSERQRANKTAEAQVARDAMQQASWDRMADLLGSMREALGGVRAEFAMHSQQDREDFEEVHKAIDEMRHDILEGKQ